MIHSKMFFYNFFSDRLNKIIQSRFFKALLADISIFLRDFARHGEINLLFKKSVCNKVTKIFIYFFDQILYMYILDQFNHFRFNLN